MSGNARLRIEHSIFVAIVCCAISVACEQPDTLSEAHSLVDAGKLPEAEVVLRNELEVHPTSPDAHFLLGYVLFREQKPKESLTEFTAGAKYRHPNVDELKTVASDYVLLGDFGDADKWFSQVLIIRPDDADTWYLLGRTKFSETNYSDAVSCFQRSLTLRPKYVEAENNLGLSWKALNEPEKARAAFQTAIDWQGESPQDAQPFLNLGTLLADQNNLDQAIPLLRRAASIAPNNPTIHEELGKAYMAQQDLQSAQKELELAISLAPEVSSLHYKLAQVYRKEGFTDRAEREFAKCEQLSSTHSSTRTPNPPQ